MHGIDIVQFRAGFCVGIIAVRVCFNPVFRVKNIFVGDVGSLFLKCQHIVRPLVNCLCLLLIRVINQGNSFTGYHVYELDFRFPAFYKRNGNPAAIHSYNVGGSQLVLFDEISVSICEYCILHHADKLQETPVFVKLCSIFHGDSEQITVNLQSASEHQIIFVEFPVSGGKFKHERHTVLVPVCTDGKEKCTSQQSVHSLLHPVYGCQYFCIRIV